MFKLENRIFLNKRDLYDDLFSQCAALIGDEKDFLANSANVSSLIFHTVPKLNWAGFYLYKEGELVLGPFQGKPACIRIKIGSGVCGTAAEKRQTVIVPDVHQFPGHIACDSASNSEIVVPLLKEGILIGVLDLDSLDKGNFDEDDRRGLEKIVELLLAKSSSYYTAVK